MNLKEIEAVVNSSAPKRYEYFIKKVADFEEIWGLFSEGWAIVGDSEGNIKIPFWPKKEFAEICAAGIWRLYVPKSIPLEDFMSKWLPGMEKDNREAAVFYTNNDVGVSVDVKRLKNDLELELKKY